MPRVARPRLPRPTDAELQILGVMWQRGGSTVRQIFNETKKVRNSGYNSVLKLVQIMHDKGYVKRDESTRPLVFTPTQSEQQTQKLMARDLLERCFGGSARNLIMQVLALKRATPQELADIREQLDKMTRGKA